VRGTRIRPVTLKRDRRLDPMTPSFRLCMAAVLFAVLPAPAPGTVAVQANPVRVLVWDEQQPEQKKAYDNFLGNAIARHLSERPGLTVTTACLADSEQGLADAALDACDVLVWWGHVQNSKIDPATGRRIVERIKSGKLSLVALHSAHWSTPFVEAMHERTRLDARRAYPAQNAAGEKNEIEFVLPPKRYTVPGREARITPATELRKFPDGTTKVTVHLPNCCFPAYRADGKPSTLVVLRPEHPLAAGLPRTFPNPQDEMYDEPFHIPEPDQVIFEERWATGEWFRSGCVWTLGSGRIFYFRPGHETFPVYKDPLLLKVIENAVRWLGERPSGK
jgi:trehalose utilization protein